MRDYKEEINQLLENKRKEIVITKQEFMDFRKVYFDHEKHDLIVGDAKIGGDVHFHLRGDKV